MLSNSNTTLRVVIVVLVGVMVTLAALEILDWLLPETQRPVGRQVVVILGCILVPLAATLSAFFALTADGLVRRDRQPVQSAPAPREQSVRLASSAHVSHQRVASKSVSHAPAAAVDPAADLTQPLIAASTPVNWLLQIETGDAAGSIYPLTDPMVAGRGQDADILLLSKQISRRHARFALADGGPAVEDLESRNGTYVNGRPVLGQQLLLDGDEVRLHDVVIRIRQRGQHAA